VKRLVLCCDGTWNRADQESNGEPCPTNVVRIGYRVAKRDAAGVPQIVYYDQGVGTGNTVDRLTGGAIGKGLDDNIYDAYRFLVCNYEPGDELYFFGFSRGAFTARSVVGMARKCGILLAKHARRYGDATALYRDEARPSDAGPVDFRTRYCSYGNADLEVKFIGVWDTVGALGIPLRGLRWLTKDKYQFHDTELSGSVANAYHALAIDEHRKPFEPALWEYKPKAWQHVEQVWFCGAHSDVGGGYAHDRIAGSPDDAPRFEPQLADISLDWMIEKARACGLAFDAEVLAANPLALEPRSRIHDSKTGLYNLVPEYDRVIGLATIDRKQTDQPDATQALHPSVLARWDADPGYRPESLKRYFERTRDPRSAR
jgi:hypothetical protein